MVIQHLTQSLKWSYNTSHRILRNVTRPEGVVMKLRFASLCLVLLTLVAAFTISGQEFRGAIHGMVMDAKGLYQLPHVNPGSYNVEARLEGFKPIVRKSVAVRIGDDLPIDFKMELGGVTETISVTATLPVLDTSPNTGQVIESKQIE